VVNAAYVWGVTTARAGRVLLRVEDHDRARSRPDFEAAILEDLDWLGFVAEEPLVRQSERGHAYLQALNVLRAQGLVYVCACSRATMTTGAARGSPYPGTCRDLALAETSARGLRIRLDPSIEPFDDQRLGPQEQRPFEQCGDLLARDRDGNWTYQFAATVDDYAQGVTLVIRGEDLLSSTGRQLQLARLLGRVDPPRFLHHALVMKSPPAKLSKTDGDTGVRHLRARGWSAERVIGRALALAGVIDSDRSISAGEVADLFR
jgi:glutamyl/glutaminyl-tRNA synthetase